MSDIHAVLLDMDDTLYPEREYVLSGFHAVARWLETQVGLPADGTWTELCELFDHGVQKGTFDAWLDQRQMESNHWMPDILQQYRDHMPSIVLKPEVVDVLCRLQDRWPLGLVADGRWQSQQKKITALELSRWFDAIVLSDQLGPEHWKPSTKPFETVLAQLNVSPAHAVYVGDNPVKDFLGARSLGLKTIRLRTDDGLYSRQEPPSPDHAPDGEIACLSDLPDYLTYHLQGNGKGHSTRRHA